ncbi:unnamed protein product [Rotaria sp. Silwood1]|nr:unnamed protein product [Rotaria sp. Silwood1]CAF0952816.1 unnamed protein product [Rotaria sp. Silwood1]CAF3344981.1 unnamed protein product [Rotaria sp. Silwood1]CAF3401841.1 unnamed protein product [Rotaria sp. Silwood1]CAF4531939.1 unnamed protein product [Rotaria sp. Silwood1]
MSSFKYATSKTTSEIIKAWLFESPSHGIRRIGRANTFLTTLFWTCTFWIFTLLMCAFIYTAIINYITHPTKIHLSIRQYRDPAHFPAITFCNINPLQDDGFLHDVIKSRLPGRNTSSPINKLEYRQAVSAYVNRILTAQVNGETHPLVQWGFKLDDLLIRCIFNKRHCYRNLTQLFHPNYGNCYTFDHEHNVQDRETNDLRHDWSIDDDIGHNNYKLYLELFLHQPQYNEYLDHRAAFRIFIHRKHEVPILSQNSLFLGPNKYTKLSFSQSITSFSGQCQNELTNYMKEIFRTHKIRYTQALCYKLCETRFLEEQCKCIEPTLAVFYQFFNDKNFTIHTTKNISLCSIDDECLTRRIYFNSSKLCQECLPECEIIQYSVQSSYARFPNSNAHKQVSKRVSTHFGRIATLYDQLNISNELLANFRTGIHDNIVAVEISASPYATEILTESSMYTWVDLISSIGGQTGLWIGVSLISFVEITELLYLLIHRFYSYFFSEQKK